jgi:YVTN family beta-propeller protein
MGQSEDRHVPCAARVSLVPLHPHLGTIHCAPRLRWLLSTVILSLSFSAIGTPEALAQGYLTKVTLPGSEVVNAAVNPLTDMIYVPSISNSEIITVDGSTGRVFSTYAVGTRSGKCAVNTATGIVYVTLPYLNQALAVNENTGVSSAVSLSPIGGAPVVAPYGIAVNSTTNKIYVAGMFDDSLNVIDGTTNSVVATLTLGTDPLDIAVNPTTNMVYVANNGGGVAVGTLSVINGATNSIVATLPMGLYTSGVAVNTATNKVYVCNVYANSIMVVDGATNTVSATLTVNGYLQGIAVNSVTNKVYVADSLNHQIVVIDGASNTVVAFLPDETGLTNADPNSVQVNPETDAVFMVNYYGGDMLIFGDPAAIATQPQSQTVQVGNNVTLTATVSGTPPFTYQWSFNGTSIAGATNPSLTLTGVGSSNAGSYAVTVSNGAASATSNAAVLTVTFPPTITTQPQSQSVVAGANVTFTAIASGTAPFTYQWYFGATAISGATGSTFTLTDVASTNAGAYSVTVTNADGSVMSTTAALTVSVPPVRLINISTRAQVGTGTNILIPGFVITGTGTETLLIRADGPSLAQFGVTGFLANPVLGVYDSTGAMIASNTGWGTNPGAAQIAANSAAVGAFAFQSGSADSAVLVSLSAGAYTVHVSGEGNTTGVALAEIYEVATSGTRLVNISARAQVGTGPNILISGFAISGAGAESLLVRGDGPALEQFGLSGLLAQPSVSLFNSSGSPIATNTGWGTSTNNASLVSAAASVGAFPLVSGSNDSALNASLTAGSYTVQLSGLNGAVGAGLAELYELP